MGITFSYPGGDDAGKDWAMGNCGEFDPFVGGAKSIRPIQAVQTSTTAAYSIHIKPEFNPHSISLLHLTHISHTPCLITLTH